MYRSVFLLVASVCLLAASVNGNVLKPKVPIPDGRIVGGVATIIERSPYQVSVRVAGSLLCGGSILNPTTVITGARCIFDNYASLYSIGYGSTTVYGGTNVAVKRLVKNSQYNPNTLNNDVALIILSEPIKFSSKAQPIPLATEEPTPGTTVAVTGWGITSEGGHIADVLLKLELKIVSHDKCKEQYAGTKEITEGMICAAVPEGGKHACEGDSGGPLVANGRLVGIVSWDRGCPRNEFPGVYTNVFYYLGWIAENSA